MQGPAAKPALLLFRYPLSFLLCLQYVPFALIPAMVYGGYGSGFTIRLVGLILLFAIGFEQVFGVVARKLGFLNRAVDSTGRAPVATSARWVSAIGAAAALAGTYAGVGSFGVVVGSRTTSSFITLVTPLRFWTIIGAALIMFALSRSEMPRRAAFAWVAFLIGVETYSAARGAIVAPLAAFCFTVVFVAVLLGLVRVRTVIAGIVLVLLAWPAFYALRNEQRASYGVAANARVGAYDRLRMDLLIDRAQDLPVPLPAGQPDAATVFRYGLIPRALDPGRPSLGVGQRINRVLGGSSRSSFSFTSLGNLYVLYGSGWLATFIVALAVLLRFTLAAPSVPRVMVLSLLLHDLIWFGASLPDSAVSFLQGMVSASVAGAGMLIAYVFQRSGRADHRSKAVKPHDW